MLPLTPRTYRYKQACQELNPKAGVLEAPRRTHRLHACKNCETRNGKIFSLPDVILPAFSQ